MKCAYRTLVLFCLIVFCEENAVAENPSSFNLDGLWQSDSGMLLIKQEGALIEGISYTLQRELVGTIIEDKITFQWTDLSLKTGGGEFKIEDNGNKLTGFWANKEEKYRWDVVRYQKQKEDFKGQPTYWYVEEEISSPFLKQAGKTKGQAILYVHNGKVAGKFQGTFHFADMPEQKETYFNYIEGDQEDDQLVLQWRNPIDASSSNMILKKVQGGWQGTSKSNSGDQVTGEIFLRKSKKTFLNDEISISSVIPDTIKKFNLVSGFIHFEKAKKISFNKNYKESAREGEKAISFFHNASNENQLRNAYIFVAKTYHMAKNTDKAAATLKEAIRSLTDPDKVAQAYDQLGRIYHDIGKFKEARTCYKEILTMDGDIELSTRKSAQEGLDSTNRELGIDKNIEVDNRDDATNNLLKIENQLISEHYKKQIELIELKSYGIDLVFKKKEEAIAVLNKVLQGYDRLFKEYSQFYKTQLSLNSFYQDHAIVNQYIAIAYYQLQQFDNALNALKKTVNFFEKLDAKQNVAGLYSLIGTVFVHKGNEEKAEEHFKKALKIQEEINSPDLWQSYHKLAKLYVKQGRNKEAAECFEIAISTIENLRKNLDTDETKIGFFAQKIAPYHDYINFLMQQKPDEKYYLTALEVTEKARSRALLELMARPDDLVNPTGSDKQFFDELINDQTISSLTYQQIIEEVERGQAVYIDYFINEEYLAGDKHIYAWILFPSGEVDWIEIAPYEAVIKSIENFTKYSLVEKPISYKKQAENLFNILIKPLQPFLAKKTEINQITFVPSGILTGLPFNALMEHGEFWGLQYESTYLPNLTILKQLNPTRITSDDRILLIGKPSGTDKLLNSENEVHEVAALFKDRSKVLLNKDASMKNVLSEIGKYEYILFSTHGKFEKENPRESYLSLANDEKLTLKDINRLKLNAKVVALSACEIHQGRHVAGDELISLSRGFLAVGGSYVLATLWSVDEKVSTYITKHFFENIKLGISPASALKKAQEEYIQFATKKNRRPFYWTPFILLGKHYEE